LDLERLEQVDVVSKSGAVPEALIKTERAKVCQGRLQGRIHDGKAPSEPKSP